MSNKDGVATATRASSVGFEPPEGPRSELHRTLDEGDFVVTHGPSYAFGPDRHVALRAREGFMSRDEQSRQRPLSNTDGRQPQVV